MNSEFNLWLLAVGLALGAGLTWLAIGRIARSDDDLAAEERAAEADWISATIERWGGYAPAELVAQVLLLHRTHLRGDSTRVAGPEAVGEGESQEAAEEGPAPASGAEPGERPA